MAIFGIIVSLIISTKIGEKTSASLYVDDFRGGYKLFAAGITAGMCGLFSGYDLIGLT